MTDLDRIADLVLDTVGDRAEAEVTVTNDRHGLTRFANSSIHQHVEEDVTGTVVRVAVGAKVASAGTSRTDDGGLRDLVERALAIADVRPVDPDWPGITPPHGVPDIDHHDVATADADPADRAGHVRAFVDAGPGMRAAGYVDSQAHEVLYANSLGHRSRGRATRATIDGIHQTDTSAGTGHATSVALGDLDGGSAGRVAADLAERGQDPGDLEPGRYEVVLAPEAVGTIVIFLGFYGFNAKAHLEGRSFVELGEQQFDAGIHLRDDALDVGAIGLGFDAEGTAKRSIALIEDGVTRALVHDRRTAARSGAASTGHAVRGGESYGPIPTDLFLSPGDAGKLEDLVADTERGVLVTAFNYCRILDPKTQVVTGLTRNGTFLIEGGAVVRPLRNLRFTQSFVEALAPGQVVGVGSPARFSANEFDVGMTVTPPVRLASWNFTGGAQG